MKKKTKKLLLEIFMIIIGIFGCTDSEGELPEDEEKGMEKEFAFYQRFEKCAKEVLWQYKKKHVSSNIDFYSGFVYEMLNIPMDLVAPLFVCARMVGWLAHNIEDKCYCNKIIRPATKYVGHLKEE